VRVPCPASPPSCVHWFSHSSPRWKPP